MGNLSDLFINKHALQVLGLDTPASLNNGLYYAENSTPLALLSILEEHKQNGKTLEEINYELTNLTLTSHNNKPDTKLESYFKYYGFNDEVNMVQIVGSHSVNAYSQTGVSDLAHYMFLNNYVSINQVKDEECFNVYKYGKVLRSASKNEPLPTGLGRVLNYIDDVYSKSEAFTIMFIDKESKVDLFVDDKSPYCRILNSLTYQLLMNYHYYISNIIRKHYFHEAEIVRLQEFISYEGRQKFYKIVNSFVNYKNASLVDALKDAESEDVYNITDLVIEKIQILLVSNLPVDRWNEYSSVPNAWLESLIGDAGQLWKQSR